MKWWVFVWIQSSTCRRNFLTHTILEQNSKNIQLELTHCIWTNESGAQQLDRVSHLQIEEKRCAHKEISSWCTHSLWWTKKKRVCAQQREKSCECESLARMKEKRSAHKEIILLSWCTHTLWWWTKEKQNTVQSREELVRLLVDLQIKKRKDVCTRKYYHHNALTSCDEQRRNEWYSVQSREELVRCVSRHANKRKKI